jgi:type I restriction enzyme S subunit
VNRVKLGDVASFVRGITFKPDDVVPLGSPGTVGCMRTKNVQAELDHDDVWAVPKALVPRDEQMLCVGDVLISSANSWNLVGKCSWVPELPFASSFGGFVTVLRATSDRLDSRFLFRWFSSTRMQALVRSFGRQTTNISNLDIQRCRDLKIPLPPLPEQRRIAAILDKADALRAKRREALVQLDGLTQSIFIEMFGDPAINPKSWPETALSKFVREDDSINYGVVQPGDALDEGVPLVRVGDLVDGEFSSTTLKRIDPLIESAYKRSRLRGDEILLSCVGSIGVTVLATPAMKGFNIARAVARIPLAEGTNRVFVASYLKTDSVQNYFTAELRTVTQPTLNIKQIAETKVFSPPLPLQETFATRIQAVESLKATHRAALTELDALFSSLQHRAFAGTL